MSDPRQCPAVLIAAPASGQGKTTVTAALARLHRNLGRKVRVFKCGPDFLDPMILERASGAPVYQLDLWMIGAQESRRLLWEAAAEALAGSCDAALPPAVSFDGPALPAPLPSLAGVRIGVAQDEAFAFIYGANLDLLRAMGAQLEFFSPLHDSELPQVDSLYLPGGYPELHHHALAANTPMLDAIRAHHNVGKPLLAECGGMLYLLENLTDVAGERAALVGLLTGEAVMQKRLAALALQAVELPEGTLRGHTYHHSLTTSELEPIARGLSPNGGRGNEAVYRLGRLTASYVHFYFPSDPHAAAALLRP